MHRGCWLAALLAIAACGGHSAPPPVPDPAPAPRTAEVAEQLPPAPAADSLTDEAIVLPPAPFPDSILDRELAQELRLAADSAADEDLLERLAAASHPAPSLAAADAPLPDVAGAAATPVTFDIEIERFNNHDRVQYYLDFFRNGARERFGIWLSRMPRYEAMIRRRLQAGGLPSDLVYLALIESGFSNTATSRARAVGMWQFMKGTAKLYGLRIDRWVDERRDPYRATDAAVRHLRDVSDRFGSYYLAAAAYNAGAGKVSRGLNRLGDDEADSLGSDGAFFRLYDTKFLRRETKDYVPKLIAAAMIAKNPAQYGFPAPPARDTLAPYDSVVVADMTGLDVIARLADTPVAAIRELNPQYLRLVTPPGTASVVRLPLGVGAATEAAYAALPPSQRVTFREHIAARGETVGGIARRYHVTQGDILAANPRLRGRKLRTGQLVVVPTAGAVSPDVARQLAAADEAASVRYHRVRRGETLGLIAARYGVTQHQLASWNRIGRRHVIRAGQKLRVSAPDHGVARAHVGKARSTSKSGAAASARGRSHVVRAGETLTGLARRYGVSVQALREANGLLPDATLRRGARLKIPV
jgi:membrane-bound lytic murein transglycosylase D